jgi:hypothetical protein
MQFEQWQTSAEAYLAFATIISFIVALSTTINSSINILGMMVRWHHNKCCYDIGWVKSTTIVVTLWTIFAILKYFLGIV